jgi:hypothetical protein
MTVSQLERAAVDAHQVISKSEVIFTTERLEVFGLSCCRDIGWSLYQFIAFKKDDDSVKIPTIMAVVSQEPQPVIFWIASRERRQGYALEFLNGLADFFNCRDPLFGDIYLEGAKELFAKHEEHFAFIHPKKRIHDDCEGT